MICLYTLLTKVLFFYRHAKHMLWYPKDDLKETENMSKLMDKNLFLLSKIIFIFIYGSSFSEVQFLHKIAVNIFIFKF